MGTLGRAVGSLTRDGALSFSVEVAAREVQHEGSLLACAEDAAGRHHLMTFYVLGFAGEM
jgi:hypothetical protein